MPLDLESGDFFFETWKDLSLKECKRNRKPTRGFGFPTILACRIASVPSVSLSPRSGVRIIGFVPTPRASKADSSGSVSDSEIVQC